MFSRSQGSSSLSPRATAEYCGRWVWQSIRPGKTATWPRFLPLRLRAAFGAPQSVVIAYGRDPAALDDDGAVPPGAESAEFRRVDDEPADAKQVVHSDAAAAQHQSGQGSVATPDLEERCRYKKDPGSAR